MAYDSARHHRRSIRLNGYDYTTAGWYFVTICTNNRRPLFAIPEWRAIAGRQWQILPDVSMRGRAVGQITIDTWIVMPDHVHAIITIMGRNVGDGVGDGGGVMSPDAIATPHADTVGFHVVPGSLGAIVRSYKSAVTRQINAARQTSDPPIWQRGYYERILRDEHALERVRCYIIENHARHAARRGARDR